MQRLLLTLSLILVTGLLFAQNPKVVSTWNYLNNYTRDGDIGALQKAKDAIDEAVQHEQTMNSGKTWYYRGWTYQTIYEDSLNYRSKYPNALIETKNSLIKALTVDDSKFKFEKETWARIDVVSIQLFNQGVTDIKNQDYEAAYKHFIAANEVATFIEENGKTPKINGTQAYLTAGIAAERMGDIATAKKIYTDMIESGNDKPELYLTLAGMYKAEGDTTAALNTLQKGVTAYPDNIGLIIEELNIFLMQGRSTDAIDKMKKAIELEPQNPQLQFVLGTTYAQMGDEENAKASYLKAVEIDPNYFDAYNNLAAIYIDKANALIEEMNNLGFSSAEQKKYAELETKRDEYYEIALPYLEKAHEIAPDDVNTLIVLKEVYAKMANYDKMNEVKDKLAELGY